MPTYICICVYLSGNLSKIYLYCSKIAIGVLMLLALTVERFLSVCYPAQARNLCDTNRAYITVLVIPIATLLLYTPNMFIADLHSCLDVQGMFNRIDQFLFVSQRIRNI